MTCSWCGNEIRRTYLNDLCIHCGKPNDNPVAVEQIPKGAEVVIDPRLGLAARPFDVPRENNE